MIKKKLIDQINRNGAITFEKFMELALYDVEEGYYTSGKVEIGKEGDFYTSPTVNSAFGEVIGNLIEKYIVQSHRNIKVIEIGGAKGYLALDILNSLKLKDNFLYNSTEYIIIEKNRRAIEDSKKVLREHNDKVIWLSSMDTVDLEIDGIVIANEIFDSLPFHRLKVVDGGLKEILVLYDKKKDEFIETYGNIEDEEIIKLLLESEFEFVENQELEVSTNSRKLLTEINSLLKNGLILIIDYGYLSKELYSSKRLNGTYKCLYKHKIIKNPYINIGNQDITAHVNFDYLTSIGKEFGFSLLKYTTQSQFLIDWGILEIIEKYSDKEINDQENINSRLAIKTLLLPEFMGESFKVLLMSKGESKYLKNFYTDTEFKMSFRLL